MVWIPIAILAIAIGTGVVWVLQRPARLRKEVATARADFEGRRGDLQRLFLAAASATGKPRGLSWKQCDFQGEMLLARDRATRELVALIGVTISFEAIEGGGMEDVEAVGNLRAATAVFDRRDGNWVTQGRAVFNLEPREVLERYGESLEPVNT
jgi:hypothetical protein